MDLNDETFYNELINIELNVPCSSWENEEYCLKNFGPDWRMSSIKGIVKKFKISRKSKQPLFEIHFPEKKGDKTFTGYPLEYIWQHSEEDPLLDPVAATETLLQGFQPPRWSHEQGGQASPHSRTVGWLHVKMPSQLLANQRNWSGWGDQEIQRTLLL